MNLNHEINAFAARVAYCMGVKRADFTDEEMLFIETAYEIGEAPADTALFLDLDRQRGVITEEEE